MTNKDLQDIVENYYIANNALTRIGTKDNIPIELRNRCLNASVAVTEIIHYVNDNKDKIFNDNE